MADLESLAENYSFIYFLASVVLLLGLFFLAFPLLLKLAYTRRIRAFDIKTVLFLTILIALVVAASQLVYYSSKNPALLLPFVVLSCALKFGSPATMMQKMRDKATDREAWASKKKLLFYLSLGAGIYTIATTLTDEAAVTMVETLLTTFASAYSFSKIYLEILFKYSKTKGNWFNWLAGFFIGVSFIILIPFLVPEFALIYKLTGGLGWLGAVAFLALAGEPPSQNVEDGETDEQEGSPDPAGSQGEGSFQRKKISAGPKVSPQGAVGLSKKGFRRQRITEKTNVFSRKKL